MIIKRIYLVNYGLNARATSLEFCFPVMLSLLVTLPFSVFRNSLIKSRFVTTAVPMTKIHDGSVTILKPISSCRKIDIFKNCGWFQPSLHIRLWFFTAHTTKTRFLVFFTIKQFTITKTTLNLKTTPLLWLRYCCKYRYIYSTTRYRM